MSLPHHRLLLSIILLASLSLSIAAFTPAIPKAHAGVLTPGLLIKPASQPLAAAGSTVTFNVAVENMSSFAGWDVYVKSDPTILNPTSFTVVTFAGGLFESIHCIDGGIAGAISGCDLNDGPGIVHSGVASISGFAVGSATLITITYAAVAGPGTKISFPDLGGTVTSNNGLNSILDTNGANITGVAEIGGTYGSLVKPTSTSVSCGTSQVVVGASVSCTATVMDTSTTPSTPSGTVAFISNGAGTFSGSPCTLAGTGATSTCSATYSPSAVGSQTITGTYSGDASHSTSSGTATVTVVAALVADFTSAPAAPVVGATVSFTPSVSGGTTPYSYSWTFGDGGTSTVSNPTHTYATAGTFAVALAVTDSSTPHQTKTASHSVIVSAGLAAAFTSSPASPIIGGTVSFTSTVTGGTAPFSYSWTFGDGGTSTVANPMHAYTTAGTFTVDLTVTDASVPAQSATVSHTVTVASAVVADFTSSPASPVIAGTVTFTSTVSGGTTPYTYSWSFGDGATSNVANPTHAYATAGTFTVTLTVTDSSTPTQSKTAIHTVIVAALVNPTSTTVNCGTSPIPFGSSVTCTATVMDTSATPSTPSGTVAFQTPGPGFFTGSPCSLTGTVATATCVVTFGSGLANPGTRPITATYSGDASHSTSSGTTTVTVLPPFVADFTSSPANPVIGGTVTFTSTVTGGTTPYSYSWTFGDGGTSTVANPTHSYATAGSFTVTLIVTDSSTPAKSTTASRTVTVASALVADFTSSPSAPGVGQTVTFTSTVTGGATPYTYSWTFGDGGTSALANPTHAYATAGTFTVTLTVTDSSTPTQTATPSHTVTVASALAADFISSPAHPVISGTVTFASTVTGGTTPYVYSWTFGDGGTSAVANPTHAYATSGTFTVTLTVTDSSTPVQSSTATHAVTVASAITADFTFSPLAPTTSQTVTFSSTVSGGTTPYTYSWMFGDGGTSTVANPSHSYAIAGTFTVTLMVTDSSTPGQSSTAIHAVTVTAVVNTVTIKTTLSQTSISVGGSVSDSATLSGNTATAGGTVTYYLFTSADCTGTSTIVSTVTVTAGIVPNSASQTFNTAGSFSWNAVYSGDANNSVATSACEPLTVTSQTAKPVLLTFQGFDLDDFDNGVGQLQIRVNSNPVGGIPAGQSGTGDYTPYSHTWVSFSFDITRFVIQGQNTIVFFSPPPGHFGLIRNVTVTQGNVVLLHVRGVQFVSLSHSVTLTFSNPPLVITSFTASNNAPASGQSVTFTATYTGGTGPFKCVFRFGDGESATVVGAAGTCSVTHHYEDSGTFGARVEIIGASTSDRVSSQSIRITVGDEDSSSTER